MTRADHIHQARVTPAESRRTRHRAWAFTLLEWDKRESTPDGVAGGINARAGRDLFGV